MRRKPQVKFHERHAEKLADVIFNLLKEVGCRLATRDHLLAYYKGKLKDLSEVQIVPTIKQSITYFVARKLRQELPDKCNDYFPLFPTKYHGYIQDKTRERYGENSNRRRLKFIWSVNQIKRLCHEVSNENVKESLMKHKKMLTSGGSCPPDVEKDLFNLGQQFGKIVKKLYDPYVLHDGGRGATIECSRKEGGTKSYLRKRENYRVEPFCILLSGRPGVGKSFLNQDLTEFLAKELGLPHEVYTRTQNTQHWDGYSGQPFTVIDDFGQNTDGKDLIELITLVSCNQYVLPMADLRDKGTLFSSKIIILNTNHDPKHLDFFQSGGPSKTYYCLEALKRRFHLHLHFDKREGIKYHGIRVTGTSPLRFDPIHMKPNEISKLCLQQYLDHSNWTQVWKGGDELESSMKVKAPNRSFGFPQQPERYVCKPIALKEPLKVRVITKGPASHACMESFQKALLKGLQKFDSRVFGLTKGLPLDDLIKDWPKGTYLSGDYTASTDCIYRNASKALLEGILTQIDHEQTCAYARAGLDSFVIYDDGEVETNRGQLMGWRLSFPILCLINYYVAKRSGFNDFLINGDDFLSITNEETLASWEINHKLVGFEKSKGKNFVSDQFGTVNSQLIVANKHVPYLNFNLLKSDSNIYSIGDAMRCFNQSKILMNKEVKLKLKKTPQSLNIPRSHGGLGFKFGKQHKIDKQVYLVMLHRRYGKTRKFGEEKLFYHPNGFPMNTKDFYGEVENKNIFLNLKEFKTTWKKIRHLRHCKNFLKFGNLEKALELPEDRFLPYVKEEFDLDKQLGLSNSSCTRESTLPE